MIEIDVRQPLRVRSLELIPGETPWSAQCELQAADAGNEWKSVRRFKFDRSNMVVGVGPMPRGAVAVSFPAVCALRFRLLLTEVHGKAALAEIRLSPAARLEAFVEKQLGKMHPTPLPLWDTYLWPTPPEPDGAGLVVAKNAIVNLSSKLGADGTLRWDAPAGEFVVLRIGMTPTGARNSPSSPEGQGLEVDKMNRAAARAHFDAFIGKLLARTPAAERKAFRTVIADSYEMGPQNWTDGFTDEFRNRYGYDPTAWLPALTGRIVGSADQTERFFWDLRRLVADRVATEYVGGLRDCCHTQGLKLWLENYGHWGFPSEFLKYGGQSDEVGGEYWVTGDLGSIECRAASSCANTYGKPRVSAESFTGGPPFQNAPAGLKNRGDWCFCEGINHFVLHVYIHQPWEDQRPGVNAWFGTEFNRHNTWFGESRAWIDYLRRCSWLLQQGVRVADAAYFIGEDAPKMTGVRQPALPQGRDFDYINAEVIEGKLTVKDGRLTLPHGTSYPLLVLPEQATMRPALLRKVRDLVRDGATVVGRPPERSPSLQGYPACDAEVAALAAEVWGAGPLGPRGERRFGKGRVVWGANLDEVFASLRLPADFTASATFRYTHRRLPGTDIYFIANPQATPISATLALRVADRAPELWRPESGRIERPAVYDVDASTTRLPITLGPRGSAFVILRQRAAASRVVSVSRSGEPILSTAAPKPVEIAAPAPNTFTIAAWVNPAADTPLSAEKNEGVHGHRAARNEVFAAPHGGTFGGDHHAGCGLAVGRNGVCVIEHGASYFAPILVYATPIEGWTHVAVTYRDGRPSLYLNGRFVHRGLQSRHTVHSGAVAAAGNPQFRGRASGVETLAGALDETVLAARIKAAPAPGADQPPTPVEFSRDAQGRLAVQAWTPGEYAWTTANGERAALTIASVPRPLRLEGPWEATFDVCPGGLKKVAFEKLADWTERNEPELRHYSGQAVYRRRFTLPARSVGERWRLDLGEVRDLAVVRLNGKSLGTLWTAPWELDITTAAQPGANELEITVVNCWNNRLIGDAALPPEKRTTFLTSPVVKPSAPLQPAGLLGPVTVRTSVCAEPR